MLHIAERFLIHFASATFLTLAVFFLLRVWLKTNRKIGNWISADVRHLLVLSALAVWALSTLREPFDAKMGQTSVKATFDFISWLAGCGCAAWGLYRFRGK